MDLIDEKNITLVQIRQDCGKIALLFNGGTGGDADVDAHLCCNDVGKRGFAKAGRAVEKDVIQGVVTLLCRGNINAQILLDLFLTDVLVKRFGAQGGLNLGILRGIGSIHDSIFKIKFLRIHVDCVAPFYPSGDLFHQLFQGKADDLLQFVRGKINVLNSCHRLGAGISEHDQSVDRLALLVARTDG